MRWTCYNVEDSAVNCLSTPYELSHYFGIAEPSIVAVGPRYLNNAKQGLDMWRTCGSGNDNNVQPVVQVLIVDDGSLGCPNNSFPVVSKGIQRPETRTPNIDSLSSFLAT